MEFKVDDVVEIHNLGTTRRDLNGCIGTVAEVLEDRYVVDVFRGDDVPPERVRIMARNVRTKTFPKEEFNAMVIDKFRAGGSSGADMSMEELAILWEHKEFATPEEKERDMRTAAHIRKLAAEGKTMYDFGTESGIIVPLRAGDYAPPESDVLGSFHSPCAKHLHPCFTCGLTSFNIKRCSGCQQVHFCDKKCSLAGWKKHKPNCKKPDGGKK